MKPSSEQKDEGYDAYFAGQPGVTGGAAPSRGGHASRTPITSAKSETYPAPQVSPSYNGAMLQTEHGAFRLLSSQVFNHNFAILNFM